MSDVEYEPARAEPSMEGIVLLNKPKRDNKHLKNGWRRDSPPAAFEPIEENVDFDMQRIPREVEP